MSIYKAQSKAELIAIVRDYCFRGSMIPEEWNETLVRQIIDLHMIALLDAVGKIELVYRRSIYNADELIRLENETKSE